MKLMQEYAAKDEATRRQLAEERRAQAMEEFSDLDADAASAAKKAPEENANWQDGLDIDKHGKVKDTLTSALSVRLFRQSTIDTCAAT